MSQLVALVALTSSNVIHNSALPYDFIQADCSPTSRQEQFHNFSSSHEPGSATSFNYYNYEQLKANYLFEFSQKLLRETEEIDPEFVELVDKHFWDLI